jgi:alanine-glyoxylate transaminase / serine-glyoxylate transaminase / serine-pyruvate transaminase
MGLRLFVAPEVRLPSLTTVWIPDGVDDLAIRQALLREANLEIGGGLGAVKGKVWRIGLMGETSTPANVFNLLSWLQRLLNRAGAKVGSGLEAAQAALQ